MDLRTYLEDDMLAFLDTRLSKDYLKQQTQQQHVEDSAGMFSKDFEANLFSALQKHDVSGAKKVLHEVKDTLANFPVDSVERKQLESILRSLYEKFKHYLETESTLSKFEDAISSIDDPELAAKKMEPVLETVHTQTSSQSLTQPNAATSSQSIAQPSSQSMLPPSAQATATQVMRTQSILPPSAQGNTQTNTRSNNQTNNQTKTSNAPVIAKPAKIENITKPTLAENFAESLAKKKTNVSTSTQPLVPQSDIAAVLSNLNFALESGSLVLAHKHYKQAKELYSHVAQDKQQGYKTQLLAAHNHISTVLPIESRLRAAMNDGDLHEAMLHYEELRDVVRELPREQQLKHTKRIRAYYTWIMSAWQKWQSGHLEKHEKKLTGQP